MTVKDFVERLVLGDNPQEGSTNFDKMLIWKEDLDKPGWANIDIKITDTTIEIGPDKSPSPFSSDR